MAITRWLIPLPAILFAVIPQNAQAEPLSGITTTYYTIDEIPPVKTTTEYPVCGTETENNINRNYDYELFEDCTYDLFMVHMVGFIDIPEHETIELMLASDDGGTMEIGDTEWGNWNDQGCSWMESGELELEPGSNAFTVWMYENGGAACLMLAWNIDNDGWAIVPDEAYTRQAVATTTTSSSTTTTVVSTTTTSSTTTTVQETTTSWESSTTSTIPTTTSTTTVVQTTVPATTTTTSLPVPTATTTTTEVIVSTTTTQPEVEEKEPEESQETTSPTTETLPEPSTTEVDTSEPEPETSTTYPDDLPEDFVEPDETVPEDVPVETSAPEAEEGPEGYTPDTTEVKEPYSSSTTLPDVLVGEPVTDEQIEEILDTLVEAEPEQIVAAITQVLAAEITSDQATEIASSPEVLAAITEDQAEELFEQIDVEELTEEQLEEFTAAIQEAPTKVKKAFEKTIDIFGSEFEDYVPTGSSIPVKTRRTLVAAGALIAAIPSTRIRR